MELTRNYDTLIAADQPSELSTLQLLIENEIRRIKLAISTSNNHDPEDFNVRGELYRLAAMVAPQARKHDIDEVYRWLQPQLGGIGIDIAAGTGFLTIPLAERTEARIYAIDTSSVQLTALRNRVGTLPIQTVKGSLSDEETVEKLAGDYGKIDFVTSLGGLHHITDSPGKNGELRNNQKLLFENVDRLLRPGGRFVAADIGSGTTLARHFEQSVTRHCLTGHEAKWLTPQRLQTELIANTNLRYIRSEIVPVGMKFLSLNQMALFMKSLHAYDLPNEHIVTELASTLGYEERDGEIYLNWPLLFFHLEKSAT